MTGCSGCIKSGIVGGIILFIWSAISWMALPWHMATLHGFNDEVAVEQIIVANTPKSGIYVMPMKQMDMKQAASDAASSSSSSTTSTATSTTTTPQIFASVNLKGMGSSMAMPMVIAVIYLIIAACLVAWMLSKTVGLGYLNRVGFVVVFGIAVAILSALPCWNWFGFALNYSMVMMADIIIGWFLAGLVMAKMGR